MKINKIFSWVLALCIITASILLVACSKPAPKDSYTVTYNLNDGTGDKRSLVVETGYAANEWQPVRNGFVLVNWCTDSDCTKPYNFENGVYADIDLYANWMAEAEARTVSVSANYGGSRLYGDIIVRDGDKLSVEQMPKINKIGMDLEGWYTDKECTSKYDFNSAVTKDMTLYANYVYNDKIARYTEDDPTIGVKKGDIIFEDISIGIYCKKSGVYGLFKGMLTEIDQIIKEFNEEYGKTYIGEDGQEHFRIRIEASDKNVSDNVQDYIWNAGIQDQGRFQLRIQQIPETNNNMKNYLMIDNLLELANVDTSYYDKDNWYAMGDSYIYGGLGSIPLGAKVPFLVYNKAAMEEYCGGKVPTNYSELCEVLIKADAANAAVSGYQSITATRAWPYRENSSMTAFVQNGAPYCVYDSVNNITTTPWASAEGLASGKTALANLNNLFGVSGQAGGGIINNSDNKSEAYLVNRVLQGKSFAGIVSWYDDYGNGSDGVLANVITNVKNGKLGVMPLSGLFTDNADECSGKIPVNTVGIQVCTLNANRSDEYFAACAIFSDYVVRHADRFAQYGIVPLNKELANKSIFDIPEEEQSDIIKLLNAAIGDPNNLYTMDGYILGKPLCTEIAGTKPVKGYLDEVFNSADPSMVDKYAQVIANKLRATFANGGY